MGMYSYIRLTILYRKDGESISKEEKQSIIQALYDHRVANPNQFAENTFDLNGHIIDSVTCYDVEDNLQKFSENYPEHIFILRQRSVEEEFAEEKPYYSSFYASERVSLRPDLIENTF